MRKPEETETRIFLRGCGLGFNTAKSRYLKSRFYAVLATTPLKWNKLKLYVAWSQVRVGRGPILPDPIQPNPQTYWPNPIRSTMCVLVPTHIQYNPSNPQRRRKQFHVYTEICSAFWTDACSHWCE